MDVEGSSEQLRISATVRDINRALVDAGSQTDLEAAVCEIFADADPYVFAWVGAYCPETDVVEPQTTAGAGDDYCEELTIDVHEGPTSRGPTARAVRTDETQVVQNIRENPDYGPWRERALDRGFASSAAVPLACAEGPCHVLNVYTDRTDAFDDTERALLTELGETITNALEGIEARNELERQKEKYETFTERVSDAFYAVDTDWTITYWNDQMAERTGVDATDVLGERLWDAFPEIEETKAAAEYRRAMETNEPTSFEVFVDEPFHYWVDVDVYPDADGLSIFSREITERKEYQQRLEAVIENTTNPIYIKNREGEYQLMNDAGASLFGLEPDAVVGKTDEDLFDAESVAELREHDREIIETGEAVTREAVTYIDGREHVFMDNEFPYRDPAGNIVGVMGISHDITGRKARERDLRETKRRLDLALESTNTGVWEQNLATGETIWNESMERLFGLDPGTFEGTYDDFIDKVHPEDIPRIERAHETAIDTDGLYEAEYRIRLGDGRERWVDARGQVYTDDGHQRMVGVVTDITERKAREQRLEEQNENLEVLNRIVRHDIRNDMQIVLSLSEFLAERADEDVAEYADRILDHADHVVELTRIARDLMETILQGDASREPTPLGRTLETQLDDVRSSYDEALVQITTPIPRVQVYADEMLGSVFRNVLKNAVQHNDSDLPEIDVSVVETDDAVTVSVADNGPGVPDDRKEEIFGKGTTGLDSEGTGIGLYLVNTLVDNYGGEVWVDDADPDGEETGAVFHVRLETVS